MARAKAGEAVWGAVLGLVRVNQGPDNFFYVKFGGHREYTIFPEQVAGFIKVANDWLFLSETST